MPDCTCFWTNKVGQVESYCVFVAPEGAWTNVLNQTNFEIDACGAWSWDGNELVTTSSGGSWIFTPWAESAFNNTPWSAVRIVISLPGTHSGFIAGGIGLRVQVNDGVSGYKQVFLTAEDSVVPAGATSHVLYFPTGPDAWYANVIQLFVDLPHNEADWMRVTAIEVQYL